MRKVLRNNPVSSILMMAVFTAVFCSACLAWGMKVQQKAEENIRENRDISRVAIYGLSYALASEQAKAGKFEVVAQDKKQQFMSVRGKLGAMTRQQNELKRELEAYRKTMDMVTGDGWSGQAEIRIKRGEE